MPVPFDKLGKVGRWATALDPGKKVPAPEQPRPDDPNRKQKRVCVRLDLFQVGRLVWNHHTAPDADRRYCLPEPNVGTGVGAQLAALPADCSAGRGECDCLGRREPE